MRMRRVLTTGVRVVISRNINTTAPWASLTSALQTNFCNSEQETL